MSTLIKTLLLVFDELLQFIFPLSDDERKINRLTVEQVKRKLHLSRHEDIIVLSSFEDAQVRALLHLVKFHRHSRALQLTATLLETWLITEALRSSIIIPIPLSRERQRTRGYNQSELIARAATAHLPSHHVDTNLLIRTRNTEPQTSLKRAERLKNMTNAFVVSRHAPSLQEAHIILLDDVMTTGATLRAAKTVLQKSSPKSITCVAIAH